MSRFLFFFGWGSWEKLEFSVPLPADCLAPDLYLFGFEADLIKSTLLPYDG